VLTLAPNQQVPLDLASALHAGSNNTVTFIALGQQAGDATLLRGDS
jgi:hypothetical protein